MFSHSCEGGNAEEARKNRQGRLVARTCGPLIAELAISDANESQADQTRLLINNPSLTVSVVREMNKPHKPLIPAD